MKTRKATARHRRDTGARADGGLTQRQEAFCLAFVDLGNASEAYRRAYRPKRMTAKSIHEKASHILAEGKVQARVAELRAKAAERAVLTLEKHLETLAELRDAAKQGGQLDAAIRAETKRGEAAGLYPDRGRSVSVSVGLPVKSEQTSATERWVSEVTGRDVRGCSDPSA